jgi:hypothetical protein
MNDIQENKLSMYLSVQKVCNKRSGDWGELPAFITAFARF